MRQSRNSESPLANITRSEQRRACPVCGEIKTLRGLYGHLMIKHSKEGRELAELANQAPLDRKGEDAEIFSLLDLLEHLNERYKKLEILEERHCFETDELRDTLFETIRDESREIADRLSSKGVILNDPDLEALCRMEQEEQTEEEEAEE